MRYPGPQAADQFVFVGDDGSCLRTTGTLLRWKFRPVLKRPKLYYQGFGWQAFRRQNITWRQTIGGASPLEAQKEGRHGSLDMSFLCSLKDPFRHC